jgi:hypothetical protein
MILGVFGGAMWWFLRNWGPCGPARLPVVMTVSVIVLSVVNRVLNVGKVGGYVEVAVMMR